jgi:general secretion pathway protein D
MKRWGIALVLVAAGARAEGPTHQKNAPKPAPPPVVAEPNSDEKPGEAVFTGCHKYPESKRFRWGVRGEVGVPELVASLGEIGCQTILVGPQIAQRGGKVSLEVPDLLSASEVYKLFYSALEVMGLTVEVSGKTLKVVDIARAMEASRPLDEEEATPAGDGYVTRLLRVAHANVAEIAEVLGKLRGKTGDVTPYPAASSLIVTDRGSNVRRMETIVRALDVAPPGERLWTLGTHGTSATELSSTIEKVFSTGKRPATPGPNPAAPSSARLAEGISQIVPVDSARLLVIVASDRGYEQVMHLAARIDPPSVDGSGSQAHVIYLANTNADDMAKTLATVGLASRGTGTTGTLGQSGARPPGGAPTAMNGSAMPLQGDVRIGADPVSNSLIVFANGQDFLMVRDLVAKLDIPRRQVYVDATILDLTADQTRNTGVSWHGGTDVANGQATGMISSGGKSILVDTSSASSGSTSATTVSTAMQLASLFTGAGGTAALFGKAFDVAGVSVPSVGVVLQALEHNRDVNVISRPHLLTMDNTKASISVGQKIPFPTASTFAGSFGQQTSYQRQDVALKLELTPHLNDSDSIRLELNGEISDVADAPGTTQTAGGPTTNQRTITTSVVVNDGETVILGGLQKDLESEVVDKIPFLGDIPLLGWLFKTKVKQHTKQNLLIILTPYVIRGPEDLRRISDRKESERREFLERYTAFTDDAAYDRNIDWRRKRGLLEEINLTARRAEVEAQAVREAQRALRKIPKDGPVD